MAIKSPLPSAAASDPFRELLEDFEVVGTASHAAMIRRGDVDNVRENVRAALVASTLGLTSIDYAKRQYCAKEAESRADDPLVQAYVAAYKLTKSYITSMRSKLRTGGRPEPSSGVFTAAVVLERLPASFLSAHFLYRTGHRFEGHAVARLILEQIAWAYAAHSKQSVDDIEAIKATAAISDLKRFAPEAGRLYGFLNEKTHINYASHLEFLGIEDGRNVIWHAHPRYAEFGETILSLGDLYGLVWELSQFSYLDEPGAVQVQDGRIVPSESRPFLASKGACILALEELERSGDKGASRPLAWR